LLTGTGTTAATARGSGARTRALTPAAGSETGHERGRVAAGELSDLLQLVGGYVCEALGDSRFGGELGERDGLRVAPRIADDDADCII
jgi:hypothetical protein